MKLAELKDYIENEHDNDIVQKMTIDNEDTLNKFVSSVISDLLKNIPIDEEYKNKAKYNIANYNNKCVGEIGMYVSLIPYLQLKLKSRNDGYIVISSIIEMLLSYIVGYINRDEFKNNLLNIKEILEISEKLSSGLINYFSFYKQDIINNISI